MTVLECLQELYPDSPKKRLKQMVIEKRVWVNNRLAKIPNSVVMIGQEVEVRKERYASRYLPNVRIVYEDEHLLVVDKKARFLSVATDQERVKTAFHQILQYLLEKDSKARLYTVHRLDYGTSGLLLFAKDNETQGKLKFLFLERTIGRYYRALVEGCPKPESGSLETHLAESQTLRVYVTKNPKKGKHAVTHYQVAKKGTDCSLLDVRLETGRRGQIRVQLAHVGHPIVGDHEYGSSWNPIGRLCLHAYKMEFVHPVTGKSMVLESKMPAEFMRVLGMERNDEIATVRHGAAGTRDDRKTMRLPLRSGMKHAGIPRNNGE